MVKKIEQSGKIQKNSKKIKLLKIKMKSKKIQKNSKIQKTKQKIIKKSEKKSIKNPKDPKNFKSGQKSENLEESKKNIENNNFLKSENSDFCFRQKNDIPLVFKYLEDAFRPKLSSPAHFRIQGGYPEPDGEGGQMEILESIIGYCCNQRKEN